ncbi:CCR4-Not complex component, Not1 protein, partial [Cardiosporidium cionae]
PTRALPSHPLPPPLTYASVAGGNGPPPPPRRPSPESMGASTLSTLPSGGNSSGNYMLGTTTQVPMANAPQTLFSSGASSSPSLTTLRPSSSLFPPSALSTPTPPSSGATPHLGGSAVALPRPVGLFTTTLPLSSTSPPSHTSFVLPRQSSPPLDRSTNRGSATSIPSMKSRPMLPPSTAGPSFPSVHTHAYVQPPEPVTLPMLGNLLLSSVVRKLEECLVHLKEAISSIIEHPPLLLALREGSTNDSREDFSYTINSSLAILISLSPDHEVFDMIKLIPAVADSCQPEENAINSVASQFFTFLFELSPNETSSTQLSIMLHMEVLMGILEGLQQGHPELVDWLTEWMMDISPVEYTKKNCVNVVTSLIRYKLLHLSLYDNFLAKHLENGTWGIGGMEFVLSTLKIALIDQESASVYSFSSTLSWMCETSGTTFLSSIQHLPKWHSTHLLELQDTVLTETKKLARIAMEILPLAVKMDKEIGEALTRVKNPFAFLRTLPRPSFTRPQRFFTLSDIQNPALMPLLKQRKVPLPPHVRPQENTLISVILDEWMNMGAFPNTNGLSADWATFFQRLSQKGLLGMEDNIDVFFTTCVYRSIERAVSPLMPLSLPTPSQKEEVEAASPPPSSQFPSPTEDSSSLHPPPIPSSPSEITPPLHSGSSDKSTRLYPMESSTPEGPPTSEVAPPPSSGGVGEGTIEIPGSTSSLEELLHAPVGITSRLDTSALDGLAKLVVAMMKLVDPAQTSPVTILRRIWEVICRIMMHEAETRVIALRGRAYFRLILSILLEICNSTEKSLQAITMECLYCFAHHLMVISPLQIPSFAFSWLDVISHRAFFPRLLRHVKGWPLFQRLLIQHLKFLHPFLRDAILNDPIRQLYKGTLRVLLVLLHDFPEFLCDYHVSFCDILPLNCIQFRNLILSAFPRNMKMPDPFLPNLKIDLLPEIKVAPRILTNVSLQLLHHNLKGDIDEFWKTRDPNRLSAILTKLLVSKQEALRTGTKYNIPLMNALLLYVGVTLPGRLPGDHPTPSPSSTLYSSVNDSSPPLQLLLYMAKALDMEGRYILICTVSNHLRYPNSHTHYFSCVLLWLFYESHEEIIQEQITRVLLERLIVHRPHPWGLLITFIELIKNV